ncbi:MAG: outer membrane beta-barrel protein [Acidobacteria bacterium]|jgi:opacity protein-like surface antigen|nr:outer membrane beta-barrel protein [Acidobacteriota bacterium]
MRTQNLLGRRLQTLAIGLFAAGTLLAAPAAAYADITVFFGAGHKPETRTAKGAAFGLTLLAVGFELEYSDISEKDSAAAPRLRTAMANAIVQTPTAGAQLYATAGVGMYRENLRGEFRETNTGLNIGGGLKLNLLGPMKMRVDYRLFRLRGNALYSTVHRVYAGVSTSF